MSVVYFYEGDSSCPSGGISTLRYSPASIEQQIGRMKRQSRKAHSRGFRKHIRRLKAAAAA